MTLYTFEGVRPHVAPDAYVHPTASLIGDVSVGPGCYVGPHASLRGDFGPIVLEAGSNVQDGCVAHSFPEVELRLAEDAHIGHGAVLHGCRVGRDALVGIRAVVLDRAVIGDGAFVGANSLVRGDMTVPPEHLALGTPADVIRALTAEERAWKRNGTAIYHELAKRSAATVRAVAEPDLVQPTAARLPAWAEAIPLEVYREVNRRAT